MGHIIQIRLLQQEQSTRDQQQRYLDKLAKAELDKTTNYQQTNSEKCYVTVDFDFNAPVNTVSLFAFARETGDFFSKDPDKHCYTNKDKSLEVYNDAIVINHLTDEVISKGLKLAQMQFGYYLELNGSEEFKTKALQILATAPEFKYVQFSNPEHQTRLEELKAVNKSEPQITQSTPAENHKLTAREVVKQRLAKQENAPILESSKLIGPIEQTQSETKLSAREMARQRLANTELRSTKDVVNEYEQQKAQKQQETTKSEQQIEKPSQEIELELIPQRGFSR